MSESTNDKTKYYIRPVKVYVDSDDAIQKKDGPREQIFSYKVPTPALRRIVGVKLAAYNIPNSIAPTFIPATAGVTGNSLVDFRLTANEDAGSFSTNDSEVFTFDWPAQLFQYTNAVEDWLSYVDALASLMNAAVRSSSGDWKDNVFFTGIVSPDEKTSIHCESFGVFSTKDKVICELLFGTGQYSDDSAYDQMGFEKQDYTSSSVNGVQVLTSPNPVKLNPYRYVDVSISEIPELEVIERIYLETSLDAMMTTKNNLQKPLVPLKQTSNILDEGRSEITVNLRLRGGVVPSSLGRSHDLTFIFYQLSPEYEVPTYIQQVLAL